MSIVSVKFCKWHIIISIGIYSLIIALNLLKINAFTRNKTGALIAPVDAL